MQSVKPQQGNRAELASEAVAQASDNMELWGPKYQALVECFRNPEATTLTKLNNAFIDFTKAITDRCHPSPSVLHDLGCVDFLLSALATATDPNIQRRLLTLFDRLVTYIGLDLFSAFDAMTSTWGSILEQMLAAVAESAYLDIAYLVVKCIKTSCAFSTEFTMKLYSPVFLQLAMAWIDKIHSTEAEDKEQHQLQEMIHHCIFEIFCYWLLQRDSIAGIDVASLVQSFNLAFDSSDDVIREQTCNLIKLVLARSDGEMWGLWVDAGIFVRVYNLVLTSHTPSAMDLLSEGLITEAYAQYFAEIVDFGAISGWICEFFTAFCASPSEGREEATPLFASSITLLSNALVSEQVPIDHTLVNFFLEKAVELLDEAPYEAKESLAFMVMVLFRGVAAPQLPEYLVILSHALDVACAGSEDVVHQSLRTITQVIDAAQKSGVDLRDIAAFNDVIAYLRGIVDTFEGGPIEDEGNLILDRIEELLGLTID